MVVVAQPAELPHSTVMTWWSAGHLVPSRKPSSAEEIPAVINLSLHTGDHLVGGDMGAVNRRGKICKKPSSPGPSQPDGDILESSAAPSLPSHLNFLPR